MGVQVTAPGPWVRLRDVLWKHREDAELNAAINACDWREADAVGEALDALAFVVRMRSLTPGDIIGFEAILRRAGRLS